MVLDKAQNENSFGKSLIQGQQLSALNFEKYADQEAFLAHLLNRFNEGNWAGYSNLKDWLKSLLNDVNIFCDLSYSIIFISPRPFFGIVNTPHLLDLTSQAGLSDAESNQIMHFNWRKAKLPEATTQNITSIIWGSLIQSDEDHQRLRRSIPGASNNLLDKAILIVPLILSEAYRGVILIGTRITTNENKIDLDFLTRVSHRILISAIIRRVGFDVNQLQAIFAGGISIMVHDYRAALTPLADASTKVVHFIEHGANSVYDQQTALAAARRIQELANRVSQRSKGFQIQLQMREWLKRGFARNFLDFIPYRLADLVNDCILTYRLEAAEKDVEIRVDESIAKMPQVNVDRRAFITAFSQVLDNAVKYSHKGKYIKISGFFTSQDVQISVEDFGLGIEPEESGKIYQEGYQGGRSERAKQEPGQGLGLYIAKELIEAIGGKIWHEIRTGERDEKSKLLEGYWVRFNIQIPISGRK